jgi:RNA recognition motif-containing protein
VQNYSAGNPASVLYIKNLAKDVIADDFYLLFGEFSKLLLFKLCLIFFSCNSNSLR